MSKSESDRPPRGSVPPKGTIVHRGQRPAGLPTAGIHWSTSLDMAKPFSKRGAELGETLSVELTDPEKQVIPYGALSSAYYDKTRGYPRRPNMASMQGFPSEEEIRLRPGATFHINGRDIEIDNTRGHIVYPNLHEYAATPEAANREWFHAIGELGHEQMSLFDSVHDYDGAVKGYIPSFDLREGDFNDQASSYADDLLKFGRHPDAPDFPTHHGESMTKYTPPAKYQE